MIQSVKITNSSGNTLDINLRSSLDDHGLLIFNLEGLGSPKATVSGLSGPTYDGISGEFVKADARSMLLTLAIPGRGNAEETSKQLVYDFFPIKDEITFRVITDAKDVYTTAIVESVEMAQFSKVENAVISLYCADPYFLDMIETWVYGEYGGWTKTITYEGEVPTETYIVVTCGHPWTSGTCTIANDRGGQSMIINFAAISLGDRYLINSNIGQKSVIHVDGATEAQTDVTYLVEPTSDWIKIYPGDNDISVTIAGTQGGAITNRPTPILLKGYLPLNEISGGDALELVSDRIFTKGGGTLGHNPGNIYPNARAFLAANNSWLDRAYEFDLCPTGDHTFMFWIWMSNWWADHTILDILGGGGDDGILIKATTSAHMQYHIRNGSTAVATWTSVPLDTWMCFFCWYDESANTMYIQRDDGTPNSTTSVITPDAYNSPWKIGKDLATGSQRLGAGLQGLGLYNTILTTAQRSWIYNSGKGRTFAELYAEHELDVLYRPRYQGV